MSPLLYYILYIDAKSKRAKELLQQQEAEQNEREYQGFIRLKQKFECA